MVSQMEISFVQAVDVVLAAVGMYAAFLIMVRVLGARVLARMSTFDLLVTLMMGAVAGRVVLGNTPVLPAGVLGLGTLLVCEVVLGLGRSQRFGHRLLTPPPVLIINDGRMLPDGLRKAHITPSEVMVALRQHGVRDMHEVAYGIFEPTGTISVLRAGRGVSEELLTDVTIPPPHKGGRGLADPTEDGWDRKG